MSFVLPDTTDLSPYSTLRIGGSGRVYDVNTLDELRECISWCRENNYAWYVLGNGSNTVFEDGEHEWLYIRLMMDKYTIEDRDSNSVYVYADAGMSWDQLVALTVEDGLSGIESLSAIPGTVGGAAVQNIGAYGAEFIDVCVFVEVYDTVEDVFKKISKTECAFNYRSSIFKAPENRGRYIVTGAVLQLQKNPNPVVSTYPDVEKYFADTKDIPTVSDIRTAITTIRWGKLPRPEILPNCGSFFAHPHFSDAFAETLKEKFADMPIFESNTPGIKKALSGWLIDQVGLKGYRIGNVGIYDKHALIIVNHGGGTFAELSQLIATIQEKVFEKFDIRLEPEVGIVLKR